MQIINFREIYVGKLENLCLIYVYLFLYKHWFDEIDWSKLYLLVLFCIFNFNSFIHSYNLCKNISYLNE